PSVANASFSSANRRSPGRAPSLAAPAPPALIAALAPAPAVTVVTVTPASALSDDSDASNTPSTNTYRDLPTAAGRSDWVMAGRASAEGGTNRTFSSGRRFTYFQF